MRFETTRGYFNLTPSERRAWRARLAAMTREERIAWREWIRGEKARTKPAREAMRAAAERVRDRIDAKIIAALTGDKT